MQIIIAHDHAVTRAQLEQFVRQLGHEPLSFSNGIAAMSEFRKSGFPSVAILNLALPGLGGIEICKRLKEMRTSTYVILLSSSEDDVDMLEALEAGASFFSQLPINREELRMRLEVGLRITGMQATAYTRLQQLEKQVEAFTVKGEI